MSSDILKLFEGLTFDQVQEFKRRIVPALEQVRAEIVLSNQTERNTGNMNTKHLKDHLEKVKQDNQKRIDGLTAQIEARKSKGLDYADLEKELAQVKTTAARSEELAARRLADAEKAAFARVNPDGIEDLRRKDAEIDANFKGVMRQLITYMMEDPRTISSSLEMLFIAKAIERIGDHAMNIAEHVVYVARGQDVRFENSQASVAKR